MASTRATATRTAARLLVAGGAVATLALVAGPAVASPAAAGTATAPATPLTTAITTAVRTSPATAGVPRGAYAVTDVRTAGADATWAGAALQPTGDDLDPATVVLHRVAGTWTVVDLGTAQVGCGTAPAPVATDLGLGC
jgi:hypothetical protein